MATDDLRRALEHVGERLDLGEYEIEAYLAVLEHGRLTASEIADHTDIPQPRVYDTVRSLGDRGLVELRESRPMKVVAVDPREALSDAQSSLEALVEELAARYTAPARGTEAVSLVTSRSTILRHLEEVIGAATFELAVALTPDLLGRFEDRLREAVAAGVAVELLLAPAAEAPDRDEYDYASVATEVRTRRGVTTPVVAVADGEYAVYATRAALGEDRYGLVVNRSELGFLASVAFGRLLWTTTQQVLQGDGAPALPRRYASISRCATDLRDLDGEVYATVEGRDVETGRPRVVSGAVVDVEFAEAEEAASLTVETDAGRVRVGGRLASYEDVEAHEIHVGREAPPG